MPIPHPPVILLLSVQAFPVFLGNSSLRITASNSVSGVPFAATQDADEDSLRFEWRNGIPGTLLTNGVSVTLNYTQDEQRPWYYVTLYDPVLSFELGEHLVFFIASDNAFSVTNSLTLNVITVSNAMTELTAAVDDVNSADEAFLLESLNGASAAAAQSQWSVAAAHLDEFIARVQASVALDEDRKRLFQDSAQAVRNALPSG